MLGLEPEHVRLSFTTAVHQSHDTWYFKHLSAIKLCTHVTGTLRAGEGGRRAAVVQDSCATKTLAVMPSK